MVHTRWVIAAVLLMAVILAPLGLSQDADCLDQLNPLARLRIKTNQNFGSEGDAVAQSPSGIEVEGQGEGSGQGVQRSESGASDSEGAQPSETIMPPPPPDSEPPTLDLRGSEGWLGALQVLAYLLIGALVVFLVYWVLKSLGSRSGSVRLETSRRKVNDDELSYAPVPKLMTNADSLATQGDYRMAVRYLLTAALRHLEKRGVLDYKTTATDWEHLRALRATGHLTLYEQLVLATQIVERRWYGVSPASQADYDQVQHIVNPILNAKGSV